MGIEVEIGFTPPSIFDEMPPLNAVEKLIAKTNSAKLMAREGSKVLPKEDEKMAARQLFISDRAVIDPNITEGTALHLRALLDKYDFDLLDTTTKIRNYVCNRLVEESAPEKNPKTALKALELLGKIGDVGMFLDRKEVTIHQKPNSEIEAALREKLERYANRTIDITPPQQVLT